VIVYKEAYCSRELSDWGRKRKRGLKNEARKKGGLEKVRLETRRESPEGK